MGVGGQCHAPAAFYPRERPGTIVHEAGWAPGLVWKGAENLAPTGIRSPDRPARSQSLYRLSYPAHSVNVPYAISQHRPISQVASPTERSGRLSVCAWTTANYQGAVRSFALLNITIKPYLKLSYWIIWHVGCVYAIAFRLYWGWRRSNFSMPNTWRPRGICRIPIF